MKDNIVASIKNTNNIEALIGKLPDQMVNKYLKFNLFLDQDTINDTDVLYGSIATNEEDGDEVYINLEYVDEYIQALSQLKEIINMSTKDFTDYCTKRTVLEKI